MITQCSHDHKERRQKLIRRIIFFFLLILSFIVLVIFLLIWAILQPKKPTFIIQDATLYAFSVSADPNLFTSNFQVTIFSRNPNDKISIYYDKLDIYATYLSQQVTYFTAIPPTYQGHKAVNVWSPFISGTNIPVASFTAAALNNDPQANGGIWLRIKIVGKLRWRVGSFVSGHYHLRVICPAYIPCGNINPNNVIGTAVYKYQIAQNCRVSTSL